MMCFSDGDYTDQASFLCSSVLEFGSQGLDKPASVDLALHQHSSLLYCSVPSKAEPKKVSFSVFLLELKTELFSHFTLPSF